MSAIIIILNNNLSLQGAGDAVAPRSADKDKTWSIK